jgi:diguanylate cyclase (GGDEF)-like protein/PAS domain S-box-containing protein
MTQLTIQGNAHLPLKRGKETFGVLTLSFPEPRLWNEDERRFALALADRTAMAYERARLFEQVREDEAQLRLVTDGMPALVSYLDYDYRYRFANKTYKEWFGLEDTNILGKTMAEVLGEAAFERVRPYAELALTGRAQTFELEVPYQTGGIRFVHVVYTPDLHGERVRGFFAHVLDITGRKLLEDKLRHAALYDALTGLPTRTLLMERLSQAMARHKRHTHTTFALLFIDLDNFKTVNDTLGHAAGDAVLVEVATRLKGNLRETDTAARLGGDEFLVLLESLESEEAAWRFAKRISSILTITWGAGSKAIEVRASIGLAHHNPACTAQELLSRADQAMYEAKYSGTGKVSVNGGR